MSSLVTVYGQSQSDVGVKVEIRTKSLGEVRGVCKEVGDDTVKLVGPAGNIIAIPRNDIDYMVPLKAGEDRFRFPVAIRHKYFFGSTALPLSPGEVIAENTYVLYNAVKVGVTDRLSVGAGWFPTRSYSLNAKYTLLRNPKHHLSIAGNYYRLPEDFIETTSGGDLRYLSKVSAISTFGDADFNVTVSASYIFTKLGNTPPSFTAGSFLRLINRIGLVTENTLFFYEQNNNIPPIFSFGVRYLGKRSSFDLGCYIHEDLLPAYLPYFSYNMVLGRND